MRKMRPLYRLGTRPLSCDPRGRGGARDGSGNRGHGMTREAAGVLAGIALGALHGLLSARGQTASQGIINGILAAYATRPGAPVWRTAVWGALIGAGLGCLSGIPHRAWAETIPLGALVGLGCGAAAGLAGRRRA
jgi:hypothetical protein